MQRLVGGSLTWEVNPEFLSGGARRTVTFELRTSWAVSAVAGMGGQAAVNGCDNLAKVTKVSCPRLSATLMTSSLPASRCNSDPKLQDGCGVAERFGVLCVAQLVRQQVNGKYYAKYMDPNAQCVSEANAHLSSVLEFGSYLGDADKKPKVCGPDASASCTSKIGVPNKFMVQQIYCCRDGRSPSHSADRLGCFGSRGVACASHGTCQPRPEDWLAAGGLLERRCWYSLHVQRVQSAENQVFCRAGLLHGSCVPHCSSRLHVCGV
jgi:hypothetical protein